MQSGPRRRFIFFLRDRLGCWNQLGRDSWVCPSGASFRGRPVYVKVYSSEATGRIIADMVLDGSVTVTGAGKPHDPQLFSLPESESSLPP